MMKRPEPVWLASCENSKFLLVPPSIGVPGIVLQKFLCIVFKRILINSLIPKIFIAGGVGRDEAAAPQEAGDDW
jgi:hypothetical protein